MKCTQCYHFKLCAEVGFILDPLHGGVICDYFENSANIAPIKYGKWKLHRNGSATCNQCNTTQANIWDFDSWQEYCGKCGARMHSAEADH